MMVGRGDAVVVRMAGREAPPERDTGRAATRLHASAWNSRAANAPAGPQARQKESQIRTDARFDSILKNRRELGSDRYQAGDRRLRSAAATSGKGAGGACLEIVGVSNFAA
jgi:hypothetical protein